MRLETGQYFYAMELIEGENLEERVRRGGPLDARTTIKIAQQVTHDRFVGTPAFASPEQFEHSALDVRSDIYSLGETLWFALTGKTPFGGRSVDEIHRAQKSNVLPVEQLKAAHVPSRLRSLLESMLALEPASRPVTLRPAWANPTAPSPLCRNYSRSLPQACHRSLLHCFGSIRCSIRSGMIRASKNSARQNNTKSRELFRGSLSFIKGPSS
jgi:serine/threonine protein kinase